MKYLKIIVVLVIFLYQSFSVSMGEPERDEPFVEDNKTHEIIIRINKKDYVVSEDINQHKTKTLISAFKECSIRDFCDCAQKIERILRTTLIKQNQRNKKSKHSNYDIWKAEDRIKAEVKEIIDEAIAQTEYYTTEYPLNIYHYILSCMTSANRFSSKESSNTSLVRHLNSLSNNSYLFKKWHTQLKMRNIQEILSLDNAQPKNLDYFNCFKYLGHKKHIQNNAIEIKLTIYQKEEYKDSNVLTIKIDNSTEQDFLYSRMDPVAAATVFNGKLLSITEYEGRFFFAQIPLSEINAEQPISFDEKNNKNILVLDPEELQVPNTHLIALNYNGTKVATAHNDELYIWDIDLEKKMYTLNTKFRTDILPSRYKDKNNDLVGIEFSYKDITLKYHSNQSEVRIKTKRDIPIIIMPVLNVLSYQSFAQDMITRSLFNEKCLSPEIIEMLDTIVKDYFKAIKSNEKPPSITQNKPIFFKTKQSTLRKYTSQLIGSV